jgi:hypothetical protein
VSPSTRTSPWYRASKSTLMTSALVSSIHMPLSVWVTLKESLSHVSENRGNSYRRVGSGCLRVLGLILLLRGQEASDLRRDGSRTARERSRRVCRLIRPTAPRQQTLLPGSTPE